MRLPRDLSGRELASALRRLGYEITRQTGSPLRLTTQQLPCPQDTTLDENAPPPMSPRRAAVFGAPSAMRGGGSLVVDGDPSGPRRRGRRAAFGVTVRF